MICLDILKISEWIYKKLETVITFGWKDLDFLIYFLHFFFSVSMYFFYKQKNRKKECVWKREWEDVNQIRASAHVSVPSWRAQKALLGSPELTDDHPRWPVATLPWPHLPHPQLLPSFLPCCRPLLHQPPGSVGQSSWAGPSWNLLLIPEEEQQGAKWAFHSHFPRKQNLSQALPLLRWTQEGDFVLLHVAPRLEILVEKT